MRVSVELLVAASDLACAGVELDVGEGERCRGVVGAEPAHQRAHARDELLERERLHEVVVRACFEALDAVGDLIASGQHQDRNLASVGAEPPGQLEAVEPRHQHVDHQQLGRVRVRAQLEQRFFAVDCDLDVVALQRKRPAQRVAHGLVVVDDEDAHIPNGGHSRCRGKGPRLPAGSKAGRWLPGPPPTRHRAERQAPAATVGGKRVAGGLPGGGTPPAGG